MRILSVLLLATLGACAPLAGQDSTQDPTHRAERDDPGEPNACDLDVQAVAPEALTVDWSAVHTDIEGNPLPEGNTVETTLSFIGLRGTQEDVLAACAIPGTLLELATGYSAAFVQEDGTTSLELAGGLTLPPGMSFFSLGIAPRPARTLLIDASGDSDLLVLE